MDVNRPEPLFKVSKWPGAQQALRVRVHRTFSSQNSSCSQPTERITAFSASVLLFVLGTNEGGIYLFDLAGNSILQVHSLTQTSVCALLIFGGRIFLAGLVSSIFILKNLLTVWVMSSSHFLLLIFFCFFAFFLFFFVNSFFFLCIIFSLRVFCSFFLFCCPCFLYFFFFFFLL